jgi:hypothetical protein
LNSKRSVQGAIIRGKDERGRTPLLQIKIVKGLKRENFLPL